MRYTTGTGLPHCTQPHSSDTPEQTYPINPSPSSTASDKLFRSSTLGHPPPEAPLSCCKAPLTEVYPPDGISDVCGGGRILTAGGGSTAFVLLKVMGPPAQDTLTPLTGAHTRGQGGGGYSTTLFTKDVLWEKLALREVFSYFS